MTSFKLCSIVKASKNIFDVVPRFCSLRSPRAFVTTSKPLQNKTDEKVEETCQEVTKAAEEVKQGFTEVSNMKREIKAKLSEAKGSLTKRARENVVDVAAQKTKEKVMKNLK
ncbi:hypothetical protein L1987_83874 [Smallanthus sonchifolius]|uniref:Uncharacterized protein n=1 Tax=Smallanthus sonchifolius TaxID=185202 RepID=A0ACB8YD82_9ASTR|nr:hypothetical protein L1987_83874 [Smallanthus sonchifolius]